MSSAAPQLPPIDAARVLHQALTELDNIKRQIKQPFMAKSTVEASIARLEDGLKARTQNLVAASLMETAAQMRHQSPPASAASLTFKPRVRQLPPVQPSAAERVAQYKSDFLNKPQTDAARHYLQDRFGIDGPSHLSSPDRSQQQGYGVGAMARGTTAPPALILPRSLRNDPYAVMPPQLTDAELSKGLMHLVNRGLLHSKADLTPALVGGHGPIKASSIPLREFHEQFVRAPATTALEDSLLAASSAPFKLDLLTPVVGPQTHAHTQSHMRTVMVGGPVAGEAAQDAMQPRSDGGHAGPSHAPPLQDPRGFDSLMDTFSLHEFMIRLGRAITNTPEFESYRRTYEHLWDVIALLINQLEGLLSRYAVPLAVVDGKSLADLAQGVVQSEQQPQVQDLLLCLQNIQEVGAVLRQPGRRFKGPGGHNNAATTIQAAWRGLLARRRYSKAGVAAATIQGAWRTHRLRTQLAERLMQARRERNDQFAHLQLRLYQQWELVQRNAHVVLHIPNMYCRQPMSGLQMDAMRVAESAQLARLCDLSDPLVEVLLLMPGPPNTDVLSYWDKILQVGSVDHPGSRYRVIWPENHARLPLHMSTTAKILSSPATMKRLRSAVAGRLAYVLPGIVGDEEVDLCVQVNVPLMGAPPSVAQAMSTKSGARALLSDAGVIVPQGLTLLPRHLAGTQQQSQGRQGAQGQAGPTALRANTEFSIGPDGEVNVYEPKAIPTVSRQTQYEQDEAQILSVVAEAMVRSPLISKWLLKVDNEVMGCGHALLRVANIKGAPVVLERVVAEHSQEMLQQGQPEVASSSAYQHTGALSEPQKVAAHRLNDLLLKQLPRALSIASREVYPTYRDFLSALAARGGVVEACPDQVVGSPCANLFVTPTGETMLLSTHERIFVAPYRAVGTTFPQLSVPHRALAGAVLSIGNACYRAGLIGHVCVDFVTLRELSGPLRLWAVGLSPTVTASLISFQLFDFLAAGRWDPQTGKYFVDMDFDEASSAAGPGAGDRGDWDGVPDLAAGVSGLSELVQQQRHAAQGQGQASGSPFGCGDPRRSGNGHSSSGGSSPVHASAVPSSSEPHYDPHAAHKAHQRMHAAATPTQQRFFFCLDAVMHAGVAAAPCSKFFQRCYQEGLHFDVDLRTGIVLNLSDSYVAGVIGIITVGMTPTDIYEDMMRMLAFIAMRQHEAAEAAVGNPAAQRQAGGAIPLSSGGELTLFKDVQALVRYMSEKSIEVALAMAQRQQQQRSMTTE